MEKKERYKTLFPNLLKDKKLIMEDALSTKYHKRKILHTFLYTDLTSLSCFCDFLITFPLQKISFEQRNSKCLQISALTYALIRTFVSELDEQTY